MSQELGGPVFKRAQETIRKDIMDITAFHKSRPATSQIVSRTPDPLSPSKNQGSESNISGDRNMKFKLDQLEAKLAEMLEDIRSCRQQSRELLDQTYLMKNDLIYSDLLSLKTEMDGKMQSFSKQIRHRKEGDEQRYAEIRQNCGAIWDRTEEMRQHIFQLQMRVEKVEEQLGFKEKYRIEEY